MYLYFFSPVLTHSLCPTLLVEPAGERRKAETMLALAKSMLSGDEAGSPRVAPNQQPVSEPLPSAVEEKPRTSTGNDDNSGRMGSPRLSVEEQDEVVAKIRSVAKQSASPEQKIPYQDDDTPVTKAAGLKKEMEVRLCFVWLILAKARAECTI